MLALIAMAKNLLNPLALLLAVGVFGGGLWVGNHLANNAAKADKLDAVQRAIKQAQEIGAEDAQILGSGAIQRAARHVAAKQLDEEIEKNVAANPAYVECGLDADGLREWNAANAGYDGDLPGKRGYGLPAAPLGEVGSSPRLSSEPQTDNRFIPRLQSQLPGSVKESQLTTKEQQP